jgi:hypothetical protein
MVLSRDHNHTRKKWSICEQSSHRGLARMETLSQYNPQKSSRSLEIEPLAPVKSSCYIWCFDRVKHDLVAANHVTAYEAI